ncbi:helix-turn-helix transcriptional regulator [Buttiauxella sp. B2]|uniref:ArsR/SmtB family transcription factor n=1 Tax=Buttiauxella sp. B2 TaxID=2587812 RepID=UPI0021064B55|nr:winged helix-turn-helix domain-containing protein [Buttiauxella sp. B2]
MADKSRARMLCALMDGRAWTATELGAAADVSPSTASAHLAKLADQHFIICLAQGRHRYYRLANAAIAELLEKLMGVSFTGLYSQRVTTPNYLRHARTCYDHLAGEVAVDLYSQLMQREWLNEEESGLTPEGKKTFAALGICTESETSRRKFCCPCLDWSQRRFHLGGALGASLLTHFTLQEWIEKEPGSRSVRITIRGYKALKQHFGLRY